MFSSIYVTMFICLQCLHNFFLLHAISGRHTFFSQSLSLPWGSFRALLSPLTSDQPTTDHLPTDQPTHWRPTHRPTDPKCTDAPKRLYFKDLIINYKVERQLEKCKTICGLFGRFSYLNIERNCFMFINMFLELGFK